MDQAVTDPNNPHTHGHKLELCYIVHEERYNSSTRHGFVPNPMRNGLKNWAECGRCGMPNTHRVHPQAARGAMGHAGDDDFLTCYSEDHWREPVVTNEGRRRT